MTELWSTVPRVLAANRYMVLATSDNEGVPWASPLYFAARDESYLCWVSSPETRHSRNIAMRPTVAITIFDSQVPIGGAEAVYVEATAGPADDAERDALIKVLNGGLPPDKALTVDDIAPHGSLSIYCATVTRHYVLIRGGDSRFGNELDARLEVAPPS